jgi:hypothetical protein
VTELIRTEEKHPVDREIDELLIRIRQRVAREGGIAVHDRDLDLLRSRLATAVARRWATASKPDAA